MTHDLVIAFEALLKKHGSHYQAAKILEIAPDHYRKMRNGRVNIPKRTADYIILKASELESGPAPVPSVELPCEARP